MDCDDLDLAFIGSFVDSEIIVVNGLIDGHIKVSGKIEEPQLHGYGNVADGIVKVDYSKDFRNGVLICSWIWKSSPSEY